MRVRVTAYTNGTSVGASGASWEMQQAAKSIRVRNAGVFLLLWRAAFTIAKKKVAPAVAPERAAACPVPHGAGRHVLRLRFDSTWRRGRGETPGVPHVPFGGNGQEEDRQALGPDETRGDEVCLQLVDARVLFDN